MPKVALTFDDCYEEHYKIARALYRIDIPATFYCITHLNVFEGKPLLSTDPKKLHEIRDMQHEIASHTCTHIKLTVADETQLLYEVVESKKRLEEILKEDIVGIAYPYGAFDVRVVNVVRKYYSYARGTSVCGADPWNLTLSNAYSIGALTPRHTLKLLKDKKLRKTVKFLVIYIHSISLIELMSLIGLLKLLFSDLKFVRVRDVAEELRRM